MDIAYQSAVIFVRDLHASRRFYEKLLGQRVVMDHGPNVAFEGGFALWQVDHASQIVYGHAPEEIGPLGRQNFEFYFEATDLDAIWSRLQQAGVPSVHPLRAQPWGQRVFRVHDPDGHVVELGEPMPIVIRRFLNEGLSCEEVAQRTSMPLEIIRTIQQAE
jgi:catechol 2,3-dioxygenase-like lactoylglutathione lyase family enzyme